MLRISTAIAATALTLLAGCAGVPAGVGGAAGPVVEAPTLKVGDRWVYSGRDGYRVPILWDETHEVTAMGPDGITVTVTAKGNTVSGQLTELWSAPGIVKVGAVYEFESNRFDPALIRYNYPMSTGQNWKQAVRNLNQPPGPFGPIQRDVTVGGYESVTTPAGTFNAIKLRIFMQMDDETFYRNPTQCNYLVWYAPEVGAMVRQEKRSYYVEKSGMDSATVPGQNATIELVSFTRGAR